jgi:hypothetical protein
MSKKVRYDYSPGLKDRRKAIANLQFALEDKRPWFMCTKYRPNKTAIAKGKFSNWITKDNFDLACKAIFNATDVIYFYQFEDMVELDEQKITKFTNWDSMDHRKISG